MSRHCGRHSRRQTQVHRVEAGQITNRRRTSTQPTPLLYAQSGSSTSYNSPPTVTSSVSECRTTGHRRTTHAHGRRVPALLFIKHGRPRRHGQMGCRPTIQCARQPGVCAEEAGRSTRHGLHRHDRLRNSTSTWDRSWVCAGPWRQWYGMGQRSLEQGCLVSRSGSQQLPPS